MFNNNFTFVALHGLLAHRLGPSAAIFRFPSQRKYYSEASDWFSCQVRNCSILPLACQVKCPSRFSNVTGSETSAAEWLLQYMLDVDLPSS